MQIDEKLFLSLVQYHLLGLQDPEREQRIRAGLQAKMDAIARRRLYSASRTAPTPEEREQARQAYLDEIGMNDDWRWSEAYEQRRRNHDD